MARRRHPRQLSFLIRCGGDQGEEFTFAMLTFTEKQLKWYAELMSKARDLRAEHGSFCCINYFDYAARYYSYGAVEALDGMYDSDAENAPLYLSEVEWGEWERLTTREAFWLRECTDDRYTCRTEVDQVAVYEDRIHWECCIKHTACRLETETLLGGDLFNELLAEASLFDTD